MYGNNPYPNSNSPYPNGNSRPQGPRQAPSNPGSRRPSDANRPQSSQDYLLEDYGNYQPPQIPSRGSPQASRKGSSTSLAHSSNPQIVPKSSHESLYSNPTNRSNGHISVQYPPDPHMSMNYGMPMPMAEPPLPDPNAYLPPQPMQGYPSQLPQGTNSFVAPMPPVVGPAPVMFAPMPVGMVSNTPAQPALKRNKTVKKVELKGGKLVVDIPVPEKVLSFGKYQSGKEFTHLRYTAATCDPDDFAKEGFTLRPAEMGRQTELFIVMTMYNEDEFLFTKSMTSVMRNIQHLCSRSRSKTWGPEGWKKVVVCIVSDGRKKCHPRVLTALGIMGCYQDGIMKNTVNGKEVAAHIFEYTTQVCVDTDLKCRGQEAGFVPVQVIFCLKERNQKKINSHRWFFNAFGPIINPHVCILLDVGTKPSGTSLYHLWKAFDNNPQIGGACGEIRTELGAGCSNLLNPLVAAQNFEYKMSNILDKPLESACGFISVLPGAFSAYRYKALQDSYPGVGPLSSYFLGEKMHGGADIFSANMYLAEDRILCFELVTKRNEHWLLKYVKSANAETDVPDAVPEFMSQRRRWLNGSFFAGVHALAHFYQVWRSTHNLFRKLVLMLLFAYNFLTLIFSWFALGNFYLAFYFLASQTLDSGEENDPFGGAGPTIFIILKSVYMFSIVVVFILSMGNRPQGSKKTYVTIFVGFAIIMAITAFMAFWAVYKSVQAVDFSNGVMDALENPVFRDIVLSLAATYGIYVVSSLLYFEPWHLITSMVQYLLLMPSFVNVLNVFAFSNLHDVSWGTKGDNVASTDLGAVVTKTNKDGVQIAEIEIPTERQDIDSEYDRLLIELRNRPKAQKQKRDAKTKQEDYFRNFRTRILLWWMFSNLLLITVMTNVNVNDYLEEQFDSINPYFTFILWSVVGLAAVRFIGSCYYLVDRAIFG